jgi:hypothetical protein
MDKFHCLVVANKKYIFVFICSDSYFMRKKATQTKTQVRRERPKATQMKPNKLK